MGWQPGENVEITLSYKEFMCMFFLFIYIYFLHLNLNFFHLCRRFQKAEKRVRELHGSSLAFCHFLILPDMIVRKQLEGL